MQVMNMKKHEITEAEYEATKKVAKLNKNKRVDKRLQVIILRYEGKKDQEIADKLGYCRKRVSQLCAEFKAKGLDEYARQKYGGNHRSLSFEEEREILEKFAESAQNGSIVTAWTIKEEFDKKIGKDTGRGYIYMLLARHNWRKILPRRKHPKKASEEEINSSKKLTKNTKNLRSYQSFPQAEECG